MEDTERIPGYFTIAEAAAMIGVDPSQVSRYIKSGRLKSYCVGKRRFLREKHVLSFKRPPVGSPILLAAAAKKRLEKLSSVETPE